jgi:hypothetical protein
MIQGIIVGLVVESFKAMFAKVAWEVVAERATSRLTTLALRWLVGFTENKIDDELIEGIISDISDKSLPAFGLKGPSKMANVLGNNKLTQNLAMAVAERGMLKLADKKTNNLGLDTAIRAIQNIKIKF